MTLVQEAYVGQFLNANRYYGRAGMTILTGGLAVDSGSVQVTSA